MSDAEASAPPPAIEEPTNPTPTNEEPPVPPPPTPAAEEPPQQKDTMAITTEDGRPVEAIVSESTEEGVSKVEAIIEPQPEPEPEPEPEKQPPEEGNAEEKPPQEDAPAEPEPDPEDKPEEVPPAVEDKVEEESQPPPAPEREAEPPVEEKQEEPPAEDPKEEEPAEDAPPGGEAKVEATIEVANLVPEVIKRRKRDAVRLKAVPKFPIKAIAGREIGAAAVFLMQEKAKGVDVGPQIDALTKGG